MELSQRVVNSASAIRPLSTLLFPFRLIQKTIEVNANLGLGTDLMRPELLSNFPSIGYLKIELVYSPLDRHNANKQALVQKNSAEQHTKTINYDNSVHEKRGLLES